jgi:hypothetical protein
MTRSSPLHAGKTKRNNLRRFALTGFLLTAFASTVLYAEFEAGYYSPAGAQMIEQRLPFTFTPGATYQAGAYPLYPSMLVPGDGRQDVEAYCNTCHTPSYITMQPPLPADTWSAEVKKMTDTHGAQIPAESVKSIVAYLQAHYTPETRKR